MVVETDQQGIDNFLLIEEHTNYPQEDKNKKQRLKTRTTTKIMPKVEPCLLGIDEDELNDDNDDDPTFDMDVEAKNDSSDDQEEDELSSLSEMSGSERKPVVKKKSEKTKNNKKYGIKRIPKESELR